MNIKQLECYIALAETLNFTKAADRCYISLSAFSRQIAALEDELGCVLIRRSKVNPKLTLAGEKMYTHAKQILYHSSEMKNIATLSKNGGLGSFRVGIMERGMTHYFVDIIKEYQELHPEVNFEFRTYTENDLIKALAYQRVDFGLLPLFPEMYQDKLEYLILEKTRNCIFVMESHPLAERKSVSIKELEDEPFIVMSGDGMGMGHQYYMNLFRHYGFEPKIVAQGDSLSGIEYYLRCNRGIFLSIESMFAYQIEGIVSVPVEELEELPIYVVWNGEGENEEQKRFLNYIGDKLFHK